MRIAYSVNVNNYYCGRERRSFSTHHPDRWVPQVFTFNRLMPLFYT